MRDDDWDERGELGAGDLHLARHATSASWARTALTQRLRPRLERLMEAFLPDPADVEDAAQLALITIVQSLPSFEGERTLESWSDRVAVRTAVRLARARRLRLAGTQRESQAAARSTLPEGVRVHLDRLPEAQRTTLVLSEVLGAPLAEIAAIRGTTVREASTCLAGARERLRASLWESLIEMGTHEEPDEAAQGIDCTRWAALTDRRACGVPLSEPERAFVASHRVGCAACAEEAAVYRTLGSLLEPLRELPAAYPTLMLAPPPSATTPPSASPPSRAWASWAERARGPALRWLLALACLLGLVGIGAALRRRPPHVPAQPVLAAPAIAQPTVTPLPTPRARVALLGGDGLVVDGARVELDATLDDGARAWTEGGTACLSLEPAGTACLGPHTIVQLALGEPGLLTLSHGTLSVVLPDDEVAALTIATRGRTVELGPGALRVHAALASHAPVTLELLDGAARLRGPDGAERALEAPARASLDGPVRVLPGRERARLYALLPDVPPVQRDAAPARLELASTPRGVPVHIDGARVGVTPLKLVVAPGPHVLTLGARAPYALDEALELAPGQTLTRRIGR